MIEFTVVNGRVLHPTRRGLMLDRGSTMLLDPDLYEAHARTAEAIRAMGGWTERVVQPDGSAEVVPTERPLPERAPQAAQAGQEVPAHPDGILPHQVAVINRLRQKAGRDY